MGLRLRGSTRRPDRISPDPPLPSETHHLDFSLTDAQREVQRTARAFAEREILPRIGELDAAAQYDRGLYEKMGAAGFLGLPIPERYGGSGMDYIAFALLCEEMERADTAFRVILSVHTGLNSLTLLQWANEEQKERYLVPQARGEKLATFGLTEPGVGSDAANLSSTARRDGDRYILNGSKVWISLADTADHFLVFATVDRSKGHRGITAFIVERGFTGFSTESLHGKLGVRAGNTGILYLSDCEVPVANRVGEEGEGFTIAMSAIDQGRYTVAAGSVGLAQACLDASLKYAHERKTFGDEIGRHQLVKEMLARMHAGLEAGRLLVFKAGTRKNAGERSTRETSLAKWFCTDHAVGSALDAIQIHGAYGYSNEYPVERYLRNSKGSVIYEGTSQIHTLLQADYLLGYRRDHPLRKPQPPFEGEM
ncbi:MAG: butyryl-CoA dehydrogenase [Chloroflexi bacterium]|nr:MAG: butyryl-CoA dehydrogenase [Chloroflexota bacterium]